MQSSDQPGPSQPVYDELRDHLRAKDQDNTIKSIEELLSSGRSVGEILAAMGTPTAVCEPQIPSVQTRNSTAVPHASAGRSLLIVTESDCSNTTAPGPASNPEPSVTGSQRRRMAWSAACAVLCGVGLAGFALGDHALMTGRIPIIEVPATVEAGPNQPATTVSPPAAKKVLPIGPPNVPLVAASILPPPFGTTAPGPRAFSDRAAKNSTQIEHAPVQGTRRMRSVGPKKYVRRHDRPYYAPQRQQYIALRQISIPDRGWGGG